MKNSMTLDAGLQAMGEATAARLKLTPEQQVLLANHVDAEGDETKAAMVLGGTVDMPFSIPIVGGEGALTTEKKVTAWVSISGYFQVAAPPEGTWSIQVTDTARSGRLVLAAQGIQCGQQVPFTYKTGITCQLSFTVQWSQADDTTLQGQVHTRY
ncbi:hypothetical protein [Myxococcus qinghaiensis]|uniref:hypothetical protein n=1 Tax=Myxococcus qinghaiensis TaxID=2906758 RepID=UPI0020A7AD39|nr:hypothetical protein [Myxococcus qinghaiensis]MCP3167935.1 hypothetical protein [Myxococcus qinghaiensis]